MDSDFIFQILDFSFIKRNLRLVWIVCFCRKFFSFFMKTFSNHFFTFAIIHYFVKELLEIAIQIGLIVLCDGILAGYLFKKFLKKHKGRHLLLLLHHTWNI